MSVGEYASHLPTLAELFRLFDIRRVLETGSGHYSTAFFLAQDIERLVSIENNPEWTFDRNDKRHEMRVVDGPVWKHLPPLDDFDLVFVDDDPVVARERTIQAVLATAPGLVVIHDANHDGYAKLLRGRPQYRDTSRMPHTAVLCPNSPQDFEKLAVMV